MKRAEITRKIKQHATSKAFDLVIMGGGATGMGCAWAATEKGYKVLLIDKFDLGKGTSSRSTKLIHGGLRYLAKGEVRFVRESLIERQYLARRFPHLVHWKNFIIPGYKLTETIYYWTGLKLYDSFAGTSVKYRSTWLSKKASLGKIPNLNPEGLRASVSFFDGQFDDSRMLIEHLKMIFENGGLVCNYMSANHLEFNLKNQLYHIELNDHLTGETFSVQSKAIINATGVFSNDVLKQFDTGLKSPLVISKGVHIVVDQEFLGDKQALLIPRTIDGRVLFAVPWQGKVLLGTTDTPQQNAELEPQATKEDIRYLLDSFSEYLHVKPLVKDIHSVFAGLRALVKTDAKHKSTKELSRKHRIQDHGNALITVIGGKWTTFRKMGMDSLEYLISKEYLPDHKSPEIQPDFPDTEPENEYPVLSGYGPDLVQMKALMKKNPGLGERIHTDYPYLKIQVYWAVHHELACKLEDVLARRLRILFLDVAASLDLAPFVAQLMAEYLEESKEWVNRQLREFEILSRKYSVDRIIS